MNSKKIKKYLQDDIYFQKIKNKKFISNNNLSTQNKFKNIYNKTKNVKINFLFKFFFFYFINKLFNIFLFIFILCFHFHYFLT